MDALVIKLRAFILVLLLSSPGAAYELPLSSHSIREAYFLGQRKDATTTAFLARYNRRLPIPPSGPHVAEIGIHTPYEQVVFRAARAPNGYSAQQAEQESRAHAGVILVSVRIQATPTFRIPAFTSSQGRLSRAEFWRDFSFRVIQGDKQLPPQKVAGRYFFSSHGAVVGADVQLEFDARQVDSDRTTVEVVTPDGQHVKADFDLEKLR